MRTARAIETWLLDYTDKVGLVVCKILLTHQKENDFV